MASPCLSFHLTLEMLAAFLFFRHACLRAFIFIVPSHWKAFSQISTWLASSHPSGFSSNAPSSEILSLFSLCKECLPGHFTAIFFSLWHISLSETIFIFSDRKLTFNKFKIDILICLLQTRSIIIFPIHLKTAQFSRFFQWLRLKTRESSWMLFCLYSPSGNPIHSSLKILAHIVFLIIKLPHYLPISNGISLLPGLSANSLLPHHLFSTQQPYDLLRESYFLPSNFPVIPHLTQ